MFRLAHISDTHLGPLPEINNWQLFSKRITGYLNWHRNRSRADQPKITEKLVDYLLSLQPDHTVITGDLINLGLKKEFENARLWLEDLGPAGDHTVVLGNHDAYVRGARKRALIAWQEWVIGDDRRKITDAKHYPILRRRQNVSVIGCNSARASAPFLATGYFKKAQRNRLIDLLREEREGGRFRVVLIHHAAFPEATPQHKRLHGLDNFMEAIETAGAELILHGHTHLATLEYIRGVEKDVPVVCVPAAYQWPGHKKPPAGINLFNIGGEPGNWTLELERHGFAENRRDGFVVQKKQSLY